MALPPWLQPVDLVGAARSGAALGLSIRAQDQAAEEQAARLALAQDQLNVAQTRNAMQFQQAQERAAEALRRDNELSIYRNKTQERLNRIDQENRAREASRMALERERFEWQKNQDKSKGEFAPKAYTVIDPNNQKPITVIQTGPQSGRVMDDSKNESVTQRKLSGVQETYLKGIQTELQKRIFEESKNNNADAVKALQAELLKNMTAQSNLIMSAREPKAKESPDLTTNQPASGASFNIPKGTPSVTHISTKEDYDSLPSGAIYINDKTGMKFRKP